MLDPSFRSKNSDKFIVPKKFEVTFADNSKKEAADFILRKESTNDYVLLDAADHKIIARSIKDSITILDTINTGKPNINDSKIRTGKFTIIINWDEAPKNSELFITFNDFNKTVEEVKPVQALAGEG